MRGKHLHRRCEQPTRQRRRIGRRLRQGYLGAAVGKGKRDASPAVEIGWVAEQRGARPSLCLDDQHRDHNSSDTLANVDGPASTERAHSSEPARCLPGVEMPDAATRAKELLWLAEVAQKPFLGRCNAFLRRSGPAYLQSALTLGGGTASAAVVAG